MSNVTSILINFYIFGALMAIVAGLIVIATIKERQHNR